MKAKKIFLIIIIGVSCWLLLFVSVFCLVTTTVRQQREQRKQQELENYIMVADYIFSQVDEGNLDYNQRYNDSLFIKICDDDTIKSIVEKEIEFRTVAVYDENVVFFFCLESRSLWSDKGYAITRNDAIPSDDLDDYPDSFESFINFEEVNDRVYIFTVGI